MSKVYDYAKDRILENLENAIATGDVAPWRKPWIGLGKARNGVSDKSYRGINVLLAPDNGRYYTLKQMKDLKLTLKEHSKGEKISNMIIYWNFIDAEEEEEKSNTNKKKKAFCKYYNVFHESLINELETETFKHEKLYDVENIIDNYISNNNIKFEVSSGYDRAYFCPSTNVVRVPKINNFENKYEYYSTLLHELSHSTALKLNRKILNEFGTFDYALEELTAEISASMLCNILGIQCEQIEKNSISYLKNWSNLIKENKSSLIVLAAQRAQKSVDHILSFSEVFQEAL